MSPTRSTYHGSLRIRAGSLDPVSFAPFGSVIQNPESHGGEPRLGREVANQGSATKWLDVTEMNSHYHLGRSRKAARVVMNMFVCRPRSLRGDGRLFDVKILERHPFTAQTFVPVGLGKDDKKTCYLVIVAPTLPLISGRKGKEGEEALQPPYPTPEPPQQKRRTLRERLMGARPNPFTNDYAPSTTPLPSKTNASAKIKGPGPPDLSNLKAFIARGDQAVTYGPGTWHAPMVVLGERPIEFVVVQYANGVGLEDVQEVEIVAGDGDGIAVDVGEDGEVKAKL